MTQHSEVGEAGTRGPSVTSQALYHLATAPPPLSPVWLQPLSNFLITTGL